MQKHYSLKKLVDQGNNFVIFEEFFDTPGNNRLSLMYYNCYYYGHLYHIFLTIFSIMILGFTQLKDKFDG